MTDQPEMVLRRDAAQATLDKYRDRPFAWGSTDCVRMAAYHLRQLGHRLILTKGGRYRSAITARRALERAGFASIAEGFDALGLPRIPPAAAMVGDIVMGDADDALGAVGIVLGNGRMLGFHEDASGASVLQQVEMRAAWRVTPNV